MQQIFELITGQPPFNLLGFDKLSHTTEVVVVIEKDFLQRWQEKRRKIHGRSTIKYLECNIATRLDLVYFDKKRNSGFSQKDINKVGSLTTRLLRLFSSLRASIQEILDDSRFQEG